ncbi:helix-turn-helix domain-containing protein [Secundilactobacillus kimchicus]|uniref:helix-turn-helix domain-containing protein n=1 Tax=Secundilactobacillus kimchicus TaxID=528209 RepID=UPI0006D0343F|nr:helix-turn-helix domain-containing protein [Secundilactobacillus kimchicus]
MADTTGSISGYGYILKQVFEAELSRSARLLFCLLTVFADSDTWQAYPNNRLITGYLRMNIKTFRRARTELANLGYLQFEHQGSTTLYTLTLNQAKIGQKGAHNGYGYFPKLIMLNNHLSNNSKLIYAFLASHAGTKGIAWPSVGKMVSQLKMSPKTFYNAQRELKQADFIKIDRRYDGRVNQTNVYTLIANQKVVGNVVELDPWFKTNRSLLAPAYYELAYQTPLTVQQKKQLQPFIREHGDQWVNMATFYARKYGFQYAYIYEVVKDWQRMQLQTPDDVVDWMSRYSVDQQGDDHGIPEDRFKDYLLSFFR